VAETLEFELVSPEALLVARAVEMVVVPGREGDFGALPRHAPFISLVRPGVVTIYEGGRVAQRLAVNGGFAEVTADRCTVLAEEAVDIDDADRAAVEARLARAQEDVADAKTDADRARAEREVAFCRAILAPAA